MTASLEAEVAKALTPAVLRAIREAQDKTLVESLLPGVEVKIYQAMTGSWHADVLLDPRLWTEDMLPSKQRAPRPSVSSGSGKWWYSLSESTTDWSKDKDDLERERPQADVLPALRAEVAALLSELAVVHLSGLVDGYVASLDVRRHHLHDA